MSRTGFIDDEYIELVKNVKSKLTEGGVQPLTPQEKRLLGATPKPKYLKQNYIPMILQEKGVGKIKEVKEMRAKLEFSVALSDFFNFDKNETNELFESVGSFLLVSLPELDDLGRTVEDPKLVDKNGNPIGGICKSKDFPYSRNK